MIQAVGRPMATPEGWSICIFCEDAVALYREFEANGLDVAEPYVGNGSWVTSVVDPDGCRIDFESPTDVAEETRLSDVETL
jgi:predicted enzyme related to lactoylglutathione lyase